MLNRKIVSALLFAILTVVGRVHAQSTTLKGVITDAVDDAPIAGVDVSVKASSGQPTKVISDGTGAYKISGLAVGVASVTYSLGGYVPRPRIEQVSLTGTELTKNIVLIRDTTASTYWGRWASNTKQSREAENLPKE